ncbi:hypothetical protein HHI36_002030 [Cryptolaemus montrouzieri]|uniref:Uncharacterized protein n=1 Tax=Cryptolaemus montrouzieri TaxID=559131 RepID=A0ABD2P9G1_9CUCU
MNELEAERSFACCQKKLFENYVRREFEEQCRKLTEENSKIMEALKELKEVGSLKDKQIETIKERMKTLEEEFAQNDILLEKKMRKKSSKTENMQLELTDREKQIKFLKCQINENAEGTERRE